MFQHDKTFFDIEKLVVHCKLRLDRELNLVVDKKMWWVTCNVFLKWLLGNWYCMFLVGGNEI